MLIDTSVLGRLLQREHPLYAIASAAITRLQEDGRNLHIVPQNLFELWVVATRPVKQNGLGLTAIAAASELRRLKGMFDFLDDLPAVYSIWEQLVLEYQVCGKPAHDARLVAAVRAHGLATILTFDKDGFTRYQGLEILDPRDVAAN